MKRRFRFVVIFICCFVSFTCCLFADTQGTTEFKISHSINASSSFYFEFWKSRTTQAIASVSLTSSGTFELATLGISFTGADVTVSQVDVEVTDLVHTVDASQYLDFTFHIYQPNNHAVEIPFSVDPSSHGAGTATLFENRTFILDAINSTDEIADFMITIDDSDAMAGTYTGYLRFILTV